MNKLTFRPKKSLGQNFLVDENIARKIIQFIAPNPNDVIIEIGAGFGVLTKYIIPAVNKIIAVEIDRELIAELKKQFSRHENFELVGGDFLKIDLSAYLQPEPNLRIFGNIPYHITSPVIFKIFKVRQSVQDLILMTQREVAERIVAKPRTKEYGILSVFSQLYSEPKILFRVSRHVFKPKPEVDSAMVRWDFSKAPKIDMKNEAFLDKIIHVAFQQRRKMLRKSLQKIPNLLDHLSGLNINLERRPEELHPEEFVELSECFYKATDCL